MPDSDGTEQEIAVVQCLCGRLKQVGFICDFCYSTEGKGRCLMSR